MLYWLSLRFSSREGAAHAQKPGKQGVFAHEEVGLRRFHPKHGLLVQEVVATVRGESERVNVTIHWAGGFRSDHELVRPVQRYRQMADFEGLLNRIDQLRAAGRTLTEVAEQLNREGFDPPKRSATFTSAILAGLLARRGRTGPRPRAVGEPGVLSEHEWLLTDLARELAMPQAT